MDLGKLDTKHMDLATGASLKPQRQIEVSFKSGFRFIRVFDENVRIVPSESGAHTVVEVQTLHSWKVVMVVSTAECEYIVLDDVYPA